MASCIVWQKQDGSLVITTIGNGDGTIHKDELIQRGHFLQTQFVAIVDSSTLPSERYFRPAWRWGGTSVVFDLPACRQRHLGKLRGVRDARLQDSDVLMMKALESGDQVRIAQLKTYRDGLRNMPTTVQASLDAALTPVDIKAIRPAILDQPTP